MKMRHLAVVAAGLLAAALVGSLDGSAQAPDARTITLKETERGAIFSAVDHPPRSKTRVSVGDQFVIVLPAREIGGAGRKATVTGRCSAIRSAKSFQVAAWQCDTIVEFPDGIVVTHGIYRANQPTTTLALAGGTGAYDGAVGTMFSRRAKGGDVDELRLR